LAALPFYLSYLIVPTVIVGQLIGGIGTFLTVAVVLVAIPLADLILGKVKAAEPARGPVQATAPLAYRLAPILWVPLQTGLLVWLLIVIAGVPPTPLEFTGLVLSMGIACGGIGITIAHELTHRPSWFERRLADILMIAVGYHHFCIEHVHGHHRRVATPEDPATARFGESVYAFFPRVAVMGFISALALEKARLKRRGQGWFNLRNRVLVGAGATLALYALILAFAGWHAFVFLIGTSLVAVFLLETINYNEHYGLMRRETAPGRYEPAAARHSWDSGARLTNWLLFNLQRHADHHLCAAVAYPGLALREGVPQLPAGYATMFVVAMIPPLWFRLMNPRVEAWRAAQPPLVPAST